jgi:hypothetical protein
MLWLCSAGGCACGWVAFLLRGQHLWDDMPRQGPPAPGQLAAWRRAHRFGLAFAVGGVAAAVVALMVVHTWRSCTAWLLLTGNLLGVLFSWFVISLEGGS